MFYVVDDEKKEDVSGGGLCHLLVGQLYSLDSRSRDVLRAAKSGQQNCA